MTGSGDASLVSSLPATAAVPSRPGSSFFARTELVAQLLVTGIPLVIGSLFPIGKPVYSTLFGEIGKYNCLSYLVIEKPCPACGLTSGVVSALHGRLDLSLAYHPLGWAFTLLFVFGFIGGLLKWRRLATTLPPPGRIETFLLDFPDLSWLRWLVLSLVALVIGRGIFWVGLALS